MLLPAFVLVSLLGFIVILFLLLIMGREWWEDDGSRLHQQLKPQPSNKKLKTKLRLAPKTLTTSLTPPQEWRHLCQRPTSALIPPLRMVRRGAARYRFWRQALKQDKLSSRHGLVLVAGGLTYLTNALMLIHQLRHHQCNLGIEVWYNGRFEIPPFTLKALQNHPDYRGVYWRNFHQILPYRLKHRYSLKIAACYLSVFKEILYLDADNNVVGGDPASLFEDPRYQQTGALFWPDYWARPTRTTHPWLGKQRQPWCQEAGQLLIHRQRYWAELYCCLTASEKGAAWLEQVMPPPYNFGDKDLFWATWSARGQPYSWIGGRPWSIATPTQQVVGMGQTLAQAETRWWRSPGSPAEETLFFLHQNHLDWVDRDPQQLYWHQVMKPPFPKAKVNPGTLHYAKGKFQPLAPSIVALEQTYNQLWSRLLNQDWYCHFRQHMERQPLRHLPWPPKTKPKKKKKK